MTDRRTRKVSPNVEQSERELLGLLRKVENILIQLEGVLVIALDLSEELKSKNDGLDFYERVSRFEMFLISTALRHAHGSQTKAAKLLGMKLSTLNNKITAYKIAPKK